jgi:transposase
MTRLRGRSPRGKRLHAAAPCGRWRTTTMIGAVRQDGRTVCMTVEGAVNAEVFRSYVSEILLPTLIPGDILVMDNLSAHKDRQALSLLEEAGVTVRFLPAYSPDYNPIEFMWSKVKALLRKAEARTNEALLHAIGDALERVTKRDATQWFAHCGYVFI